MNPEPNKIRTDDWHGCYDGGGWAEIICPAAFSHPAKMAYGLLDRILDHATSEGWLAPGAIILDPFGGIGSTGILGAYKGYQVICVELEPRFCKLARENFAMHSYRLGVLNCPQPIILQGDSRQLSEIIGRADIVVSSPPFLQGDKVQARSGFGPGWRKVPFDERMDKCPMDGNYGTSPGQLGSMPPGKLADVIVTSPPYIESGQCEKSGIDWQKAGRPDRLTPSDKRHAVMGDNSTPLTYGSTPGQLGAMKPGSVDAVVSSPPYAEAHKAEESPGGICDTNRQDLKKWVWTQGTAGQTPGNLGNLKPGDIAAIVSSPPYEGTGLENKADPEKKRKRLQTLAAMGEITGRESLRVAAKGWNPHTQVGGQTGYGQSEGQLGNSKGETFWSAAKIIVEQCFQILRPGGVAIWVVKSFVRNKAIVDFPGDWRKLCEAVGFKTLHEHHAMLFRPEATMVFDFIKQGRKESASFFRRNANNKGAWRNYWPTLRSDQRHRWLVKASKKVKGRKFRKILVKAQELAFKFAGEVHWDWNDDIRIDFEVVLCMQK